LAYEFLILESTDKHTYHEVYSSPKSISDQLADNYYDTNRIRFKANEYHFFEIEHLGNALSDISENLKDNQLLTMSLFSENHVMAITINYYENKGYILKFYDPNSTNTHIRAICATIDDVKSLKIDDFLEDKLKNLYYPSFKTACFADYYNCRKSIEQPSDTEVYFNNHVPLTNKLYFSNNFNLVKNSVLYIREILGSNLFEDTKKADMIVATDSRGNTGFARALFYENLDIVINCIELILNSNITNEIKVEVLHYLYFSKKGLSNECINIFLKLVKGIANFVIKSNLPEEYKIKLLTMNNGRSKNNLIETLVKEDMIFAAKYINFIQTTLTDIKLKQMLSLELTRLFDEAIVSIKISQVSGA